MKCVLAVCLFLVGAHAAVSLATVPKYRELNTKEIHVPFIEPCHWQDSKCILESSKKALTYVVAGFPELGIPSMNPLIIKKEINGDTGDIKLKMRDVVIEGLANCELINVERPEKLKINIKVECPIKISGHYVLHGKIFLIEVSGDDKFTIQTDKLLIEAFAKLAEHDEDGKQYYKISSFDYKYDPIKEPVYSLENINGDAEKAAIVNEVLNKNSRAVTTDLGKEVLREIITLAVKQIGKMFGAMTKEEFELP